VKVNKQIAIGVGIITGLILLFNVYQYLTDYGHHPSQIVMEADHPAAPARHVQSAPGPDDAKIFSAIFILFNSVYVLSAFLVPRDPELEYVNFKSVWKKPSWRKLKFWSPIEFDNILLSLIGLFAVVMDGLLVGGFIVWLIAKIL